MKRIRVSLTPAQLTAIMAAAEMLPPPLRHSFILRIEQKLSLRGSGSVSDALVADVINTVFSRTREHVCDGDG